MSAGLGAALSALEGDVSPGPRPPGPVPNREGVAESWKGGALRTVNPVPGYPAPQGSSRGIHSPAALDPHYSFANLKVNTLGLALSLHYAPVPRGGKDRRAPWGPTWTDGS